MREPPEYVEGRATLFVTLDELLPRHPGTELEDAYAAAAQLAASGLEFAVASLPRSDDRGTFTVALAERAVSVTPWRDGVSGSGGFRDAAEALETAC